jgi:hypothetical protein
VVWVKAFIVPEGEASLPWSFEVAMLFSDEACELQFVTMELG